MPSLSATRTSTAAAVAATAALGACAGVSPARTIALLVLGQAVYILFIRVFSRQHQPFSLLTVALCILAGLAQLLPPALPGPASIVVCVALGAMLRRLLVAWPSPADEALASLDGTLVVVTGSSTGIGLETATLLLRRGATVVFACRSESRARTAMREALAASGVPDSRAAFAPLDLSSCESVRVCARLVLREWRRCDALVCNAGGFSPARSVTAEGWEMNLGANHLGHHLLSQLLLPLLRASPRGGRVVGIASSIHQSADGASLLADPMCERGYTMFEAYGRSKLAQVACMRRMQAQEDAVAAGSGGEAARNHSAGGAVTCVSLHPGSAFTEVTRNYPRILSLLYAAFQPLLQCAQPTAFECARICAGPVLSSRPERLRGKYLEDGVEVPPNAAALDEVACGAIWEMSERLIDPFRRIPL